MDSVQLLQDIGPAEEAVIEHGNEHSYPINDGEFLVQLSVY
jgi:hypothetical protein